MRLYYSQYTYISSPWEVFTLCKQSRNWNWVYSRGLNFHTWWYKFHNSELSLRWMARSYITPHVALLPPLPPRALVRYPGAFFHPFAMRTSLQDSRHLGFCVSFYVHACIIFKPYFVGTKGRTLTNSYSSDHAQGNHGKNLGKHSPKVCKTLKPLKVPIIPLHATGTLF